MGSPSFGTPAYHKELKATKAAKQLKRKAAFQEKPKVKGLVNRVVAEWRKRRDALAREWQKTYDDLMVRCNKYMRSVNHLEKHINVERATASRYKKWHAELKAKHDDVCEKLDEEMRSLRKDLAACRAELKSSNKKVGDWELFWRWVRAHSRPGTIKWLQRLWCRRPRPAPDNCWGGGQ